MRRVVITGMGIISSLGSNQQEVLDSLLNSKSGIQECPDAKDNGLRSHVTGKIDLDLSSLIDRKMMRFMSPGAAYTYLAMKEAIAQSGLPDVVIRSHTTGVLTGSGGASTQNVIEAIDGHRKGA
jgi:3-oxoacyl-[acyl-carrier-protein] synthase-1